MNKWPFDQNTSPTYFFNRKLIIIVFFYYSFSQWEQQKWFLIKTVEVQNISIAVLCLFVSRFTFHYLLFWLRAPNSIRVQMRVRVRLCDHVLCVCRTASLRLLHHLPAHVRRLLCLHFALPRVLLRKRLQLSRPASLAHPQRRIPLLSLLVRRPRPHLLRRCHIRCQSFCSVSSFSWQINYEFLVTSSTSTMHAKSSSAPF